MLKNLIIAAFLCASLQAQVTTTTNGAAVPSSASAPQTVNPVIEWNRALLV